MVDANAPCFAGIPNWVPDTTLRAFLTYDLSECLLVVPCSFS
jgi:hypothetical protein